MSTQHWLEQPAEVHEEQVLHAYITAVLQAVTERAALDRELRQLAELQH